MASLERVISTFERMGARATIQHMTKDVLRQCGSPFVIDVRTDAAGEFFEILKTRHVELRVLDSAARHRHLVLSASQGEFDDRLLCGHDERHWFVAGLPHNSRANSIQTAMQSLKPGLVKTLEGRRPRKHRRTADVYLRQGEWFFVPCPHASIDPAEVESNGSLVRGPESKPHLCEFMYRDGEREYRCDRYPKLAFFESEYLEIIKNRRKSKQWGWRPLPYRPDIYVRGSVSHPDHATIHLDCWHRVKMNRETQPTALRTAFGPRRLTTIRYRD
jgi:hypothetical protein